MRGEFKSTLDAKGRMNFPVKLREEFGDNFMISKSVGALCIKVYKTADWDELEAKLDSSPQTKTADLRRFLITSAYEIEPDKQGRALIPAPLRDYAGLQTDIVIVGVGKYAEIWDKEKWDELNAKMDSQSLVDVAMELGL